MVSLPTDEEVSRVVSIPNDRPLQRRPIHPGQILREDFMPDYALSVSRPATALGVSRQSVNELVRERRAVSSEMALLTCGASCRSASPDGRIIKSCSTKAMVCCLRAHQAVSGRVE
jgi:addiction module HigA family antidote